VFRLLYRIYNSGLIKPTKPHMNQGVRSLYRIYYSGMH